MSIPQGTPFARTDRTTITVNLPAGGPEVIRELSAMARRVLDQPASASYGRLCMPINVSVDHDDPLRSLERQVGMEQTCDIVDRTATNQALTLDEAEAWFRLFGLTTATMAAELGLTDETAREALAGYDAAMLDMVQILQVCMVIALDDEDWSL